MGKRVGTIRESEVGDRNMVEMFGLVRKKELFSFIDRKEVILINKEKIFVLLFIEHSVILEILVEFFFAPLVYGFTFCL